MRDSDRISVLLESFEKLWKINPDLRFGQLMFILSQYTPKDMFYVEDDKWLSYILFEIDKYTKKPIEPKKQVELFKVCNSRGFIKSKSEYKRLVIMGVITVNGVTVTDWTGKLVELGDIMLIANNKWCIVGEEDFNG